MKARLPIDWPFPPSWPASIVIVANDEAVDLGHLLRRLLPAALST